MLNGSQLKVVREMCKLTEDFVSDRMFISETTLSKIENGRTTKSNLNYYNLWLREWANNHLADVYLHQVKEVVKAYGEEW